MNSVLPEDHPFSDFRAVLTAIWEFLGLPEPTPIQLDMAYHLQHGSDREILQAFRGIGKSWITCAFACFLLLHDPNIKIEIVSAGEGLAIDNATFIAQLLREVPFLKHLKPTADQRSSKLNFDVGPARASKDPSVKAVGILGMLTGTRANIIIVDDCEIQKNSDTAGQRDKIRQLVNEFESILSANGRILYLGTPQRSDTLYTNLPDDYNTRVYPSQYPDLERCERDYDKLAPMIVNRVLEDPSIEGQSTEPTRFPAELLIQKRANMGVSNFDLQMQLNTDASDALKHPLKLSDLIVMDLDPAEGHEKIYYSSDRHEELSDLPMVGMTGDRFYKPLKVSQSLSPYERIVLAIDPSGRGKDETAYAVVAQLNSQLFLLDWGGLAGGYDKETLEFLAHLAELYKCTGCIAESNFGDGMFRQLLQPYINNNEHGRCAIEDISVHTQKEARIIDTLEPVMNQHRLIINKKLIQQDFDSVDMHPIDSAYRYRGFYQMAHITRDKGSLGKDDRIDVLQLGASYLLDFMNLNQQETIEQNDFSRNMEKMKHWTNEFGSSNSSKKKTSWIK